MCASFPECSSVSPWYPTTKAVLELHLNSPCPPLQKHSLQGHMEVDGNGKMSSGRNYNWLSICLRWSDLLMQDHTFLRHSMEWQDLTINWWIYMPLSLTTYSFYFWWICLPAMTSAWYFKKPLRNETKNSLFSKLCFLWLVYAVTPSNSTHYYLTSSILPFNTETTKKLPAENKTTENLRMYSITWQSTLGEFVNSHRRE